MSVLVHSTCNKPQVGSCEQWAWNESYRSIYNDVCILVEMHDKSRAHLVMILFYETRRPTMTTVPTWHVWQKISYFVRC